MITAEKKMISNSWFEKKRMNDAEFETLSNFVTLNYGIKLPESKRIMLEGRLQKRLKEVNVDSFKDYLEFVFSHDGQIELINMIDAISTNKTDFFRESAHFEFITNNLLRQFQAENKSEKMRFWSSAASTGEEIYTMAMVMNEYNRKSYEGGIDYSILGTDISVRALQQAVSAIYKHDRILNLPIELRKRYFLKSKDPQSDLVRVNAQLRSKTRFERLNLMDEVYNVGDEFDVIFCRNVLIYFDKETQEKVVNKLSDNLKPGGYLFLGHSESIIGKHVPLTQIQPTIYKRPLR